MTTDLLSNLHSWVGNRLAELGSGNAPFTLEPLSGDAGFRCYYRVKGVEPPLLAVHAPTDTENTPLFIELAEALHQGAVSTPSILSKDEQSGFLLIEDFGDQLLWQSLQQEADMADSHYGQAIITLLALQQLHPYQIELPSYSPSFLMTEMNLFKYWFVEALLKRPDSANDERLVPVFDALVANCLAQPQVLVHRDYHSRNLIERPGQSLGVIDFQGAVWGPICYDIVSLLKDCYLLWPQDKVEQWALNYANLAGDVGLMPPIDDQLFLRWFHLTGLQRHIKVLGIFARLYLRDGKEQYIQDLHRVLFYVRDAAGRYPETQPLLDFIDADLMPTIEQQSWYKPAEYNV